MNIKLIPKNYYKNITKELISSIKNKKGKISLKRTSSNLFRKRKDNKNDLKIDLTKFSGVISINTREKTAEVLARTTFDDLAKQTIPHGFMPAVVPELKTITIGGAVTGIGIESSSWKYGLVHENVLEMDILTNNKIIICNKKENKELFFGFPNSYGTLGYSLKLKIKLIPIKKFIKLEHKKYNDSKYLFKDIAKFQKSNLYDFIDGTVFNKNEMYITLGTFTNKAQFQSNYTKQKIYYKSIKDKKIDYLKTYDYIWRWDTDWFWRSDNFLAQNSLIRYFWPKSKLNSNTYTKIMRFFGKYPFLTKPFGKTESIIQDVPIPLENSSEFLEFLLKVIGISPIWVCPTKIQDKTKFPLFPLKIETHYINFGFWQMIPSNKPENYYNKLVEKKVDKLKGIKSLYSSSFYSKEKFWNIYNGKIYKKLKAKYDPNNNFPDLYEKCVNKP